MAAREGGRLGADRPSLSLSLPWEAVAGAATCAALVILTRLPLRTRFLLNWDAAQFALGMRHFDVVHHQPHPPGYIGYIAMGRLLEPFAGDANSALVALSVLGECAAAAAAFLFARALFGAFAGWAAGLALVTSPLYWYYGEIGNTYALEPVIVLAACWYCWRLWNRDSAAAVPAAVALGLGGAIRPSTTFLLLPLFAVSLWRTGHGPAAARAALAGALLGAAWLLPLLLLSGGPLGYLRAGLQLGESVSASTAVWRDGVDALRTTVAAVALGTTWELGAFLVLALFGLAVAPRMVRTDAAPPGWWSYCAVWTAPALGTFLFVHIGQVIYVDVFVVAAVLVLGLAARNTAAALGRPGLAPWLVAVAVVANAAIFLVPGPASLSDQLRRHDLAVEGLIAQVGAEDPGHTVLVTDAEATGSYRTAQVYLPAFHRVAVGHDRQGAVGEVYGDVYEPWRFDRVSRLWAPPGTEAWVFVDRTTVYELVGDPELLVPVALPDGSHYYVWRGSPPTVKWGWIWLGEAQRPGLP